MQTSLEFELGTDVDVAANDVREKVDQKLSELPEDVEKPVIQKFNVNAQPVVTLALEGDLPLDELYDYADQSLRDRFSVLAGVAEVKLTGGAKREVHVLLDRETLAAAGLTTLQVEQALREGGAHPPGGAGAPARSGVLRAVRRGVPLRAGHRLPPGGGPGRGPALPPGPGDGAPGHGGAPPGGVPGRQACGGPADREEGRRQHGGGGGQGPGHRGGPSEDPPGGHEAHLGLRRGGLHPGLRGQHGDQHLAGGAAHCGDPLPVPLQPALHLRGGGEHAPHHRHRPVLHAAPGVHPQHLHPPGGGALRGHPGVQLPGGAGERADPPAAHRGPLAGRPGGHRGRGGGGAGQRGDQRGW